ncbi:hypothetical protein JUN65_02505 [Gluconacetobacter azotocaptans]|uniref:hypothetical protein n=1 Tax=Gluconacetobacter azotocaptans TaxID=142834 RepID=UPI00195DAC6F|nr:hypothetical protein [Gluconacetobacter azotocaptans]MBM9400466.1 hypothetical protein [Gluconacetobacter azotocaptans]
MKIIDLFRSENIVVRYVGNFKLDKLIVTFDCYTNNHSLDRKGFGEDFFSKKGVDAIHFISRENKWYQHHEMQEAISSAGEYAQKYSRVVTYGSSMGGYGAIRFGGMIGAHVAVALAPQYSIDLSLCPFDRRWDESRIISFVTEKKQPIEAGPEIIIFYDPFDVNDRRHVEKIKSDVCVTEIRLPHAGHSAGVYLSELSLLRESIISILEDNFEFKKIEDEARSRRREASKYFATLSKRAARRGHFNWAVSLAKRASDKNPTNAFYINVASKLIAQAGDIGDAAYWQRRAVSMDPESILYRIDLSHLLLQTDSFSEVVQICNSILQDVPNEPRALYYRARSLLKSGLLQEAYESARSALQADPEHTWYQDCVAECKRLLNS